MASQTRKRKRVKKIMITMTNGAKAPTPKKTPKAKKPIVLPNVRAKKRPDAPVPGAYIVELCSSLVKSIAIDSKLHNKDVRESVHEAEKRIVNTVEIQATDIVYYVVAFLKLAEALIGKLTPKQLTLLALLLQDTRGYEHFCPVDFTKEDVPDD